VVRVLVLESLREAVDEAGLDLLRREELPQLVDDGAVQLPLGAASSKTSRLSSTLKP
jgi:hypothetical protein